MKLIVGLGNPGVQYRTSRHNIGFQVVDRFVHIHHIHLITRRFKALYGTGHINSQRVILLKPMTFMNRSGEAVQKVAGFFQIGPEDIIVIHDDLDLSLGRLRFKTKGGDGGHLGIRSIIDSLQGNHFLRLKVGIGRPLRGMETADYVLGSFNESERPLLEKTLDLAVEALRIALIEGVQMAMNRYQKRGKREEN